MLIEILSLLFYLYYWMSWLRRDGILPESEELNDLLGQFKDNA